MSSLLLKLHEALWAASLSLGSHPHLLSCGLLLRALRSREGTGMGKHRLLPSPLKGQCVCTSVSSVLVFTFLVTGALQEDRRLRK